MSQHCELRIVYVTTNVRSLLFSWLAGFALYTTSGGGGGRLLVRSRTAKKCDT